MHPMDADALPLQRLPDPALLHVVRCLPSGEWRSWSLASKRLCHLVRFARAFGLHLQLQDTPTLFELPVSRAFKNVWSLQLDMHRWNFEGDLPKGCWDRLADALTRGLERWKDIREVKLMSSQDANLDKEKPGYLDASLAALKAAPNLRDLKLSFITTSDDVHDLAPLTQLTSLVLEFWTGIDDEPPLVAFPDEPKSPLADMKHLKHLTLPWACSLPWWDGEDASHHPLVLPQGLTFLSMDRVHCQEGVFWRHLAACTGLRELHLAATWEDALDHPSWALQQLAGKMPHLTRLVLKLPFVECDEEDAEGTMPQLMQLLYNPGGGAAPQAAAVAAGQAPQAAAAAGAGQEPQAAAAAAAGQEPQAAAAAAAAGQEAQAAAAAAAAGAAGQEAQVAAAAAAGAGQEAQAAAAAGHEAQAAAAAAGQEPQAAAGAAGQEAQVAAPAAAAGAGQEAQPAAGAGQQPQAAAVAVAGQEAQAAVEPPRAVAGIPSEYAAPFLVVPPPALGAFSSLQVLQLPRTHCVEAWWLVCSAPHHWTTLASCTALRQLEGLHATVLPPAGVSFPGVTRLEAAVGAGDGLPLLAAFPALQQLRLDAVVSASSGQETPPPQLPPTLCVVTHLTIDFCRFHQQTKADAQAAAAFCTSLWPACFCLLVLEVAWPREVPLLQHLPALPPAPFLSSLTLKADTRWSRQKDKEEPAEVALALLDLLAGLPLGGAYLQQVVVRLGLGADSKHQVDFEMAGLLPLLRQLRVA